MSSSSEDEGRVFDVIIAGGGVSGLLTAMELRKRCSNLKILVLEKEKHLGGRLRSTDVSSEQWCCGLSCVSRPLLDFWNKILGEYPECQSLESLGVERLTKAGSIAAGNVTDIALTDLFSEKGARLIGGVAAVRDWRTNFIPILDLCDSGEQRQTNKIFSQSWKAGRKNPAAVVLENMVPAFGIPDLWSSCTQAVFDKAEEHTGDVYEADWSFVINDFVQKLSSSSDSEYLQIKTSCLIVKATYEDSEWTLQTEQGVFKAKSLVVAHSPWQALNWLQKSTWPVSLLPVALKAKPVSVVVLSDVVTSTPEDIPSLLLVPAETVQVVVGKNRSISYLATLDYEVSFEAPAVVKAIKRLKRAKKRLLATYPNIEASGDHIMLLSAGWTQPLSYNDSQLIAKLDKNDINSNSLMFCGDTYGTSFKGDENIVSSVTKCCEIISNMEQ